MTDPNLKETRRLLKVVGELRKKCPWDKKQTHRSLSPYLLEEAYETLDAIESQKPDLLREELGDVLLQVALHAEIAREKRRFTFEDVARSITDKMIHRHPHIYKQVRVRNLKDHLRNWTRLKSQEKPKRGMLEGIPKALPSLQRAQRYGEIAGSVGFDWNDARAVLGKVREELRELDQESKRRAPNRARVQEELGDLLFTLANFARHAGVDAEAAARGGAEKFAQRFSRLERDWARKGKKPADMSRSEWEAAWRKVKKRRS